jgi:hypothetical protein
MIIEIYYGNQLKLIDTSVIDAFISIIYRV